MELAPRRFADALVLRPSGRLDHCTAPDFRVALAPHLERCVKGGDVVVLDLAGVEHVSSAGLRVLMLASRQVSGQGGTLVVAAPQPRVREIFEISRFTLVFEIFPTVAAALSRVSPSGAAAYGTPDAPAPGGE
jgi:anti-anti-sigma factor